MMCVKISPWGHSIISLIDIQRGDKTWHFSSNGFCPFFVLFLMDKVFKVMSKMGLWRYTLWIGYVGPVSWGNFGERKAGDIGIFISKMRHNRICSGIPRRGNDLSEYLCLLNILMSQAKPLLIFSMCSQRDLLFGCFAQWLQKCELF